MYASVNQVSIGSDYALVSIRRQAIISTNAWKLSIRHLGTNFSGFFFLSKHNFFHSLQCIWKLSSAKWRPFCPGGDELIARLSYGVHVHASCFAMFCCGLISCKFCIYFKDSSCVFGQSCDCSSASEPSNMDICKYIVPIHHEIICNISQTKHHQSVRKFHWIYWIMFHSVNMICSYFHIQISSPSDNW